jgi:hypothetical protein
MVTILSSICHNARANLKKRYFQIKCSYIHEIVAALLRYKTKAAFDSDNNYNLHDAEFIILDMESAITRGKILLKDESITKEVVNELLNQFKEGYGQNSVFESIEDFAYNYLNEYMENEVDTSEQVSGVVAETNACFDSVDLDYDYIEELKFDETQIFTVIAEGVYSGENYEDKVFSGDRIDFSIEISFNRIGRAGLIHLETDITCAREDYSEAM